MAYTVALAEDNRVNKNTFIQKLQAYPALQLLFTADNGRDFLQQLQGLPHNKLPQVVFYGPRNAADGRYGDLPAVEGG